MGFLPATRQIYHVRQPLRLAGPIRTCQVGHPLLQKQSNSQPPDPSKKIKILPASKIPNTVHSSSLFFLSRFRRNRILYESLKPFPLMATMDNPTAFTFMNRNLSTSSTDSSSAFSDCNSDRSGEFAGASHPHLAQRILLSTASDSYFSDELVRNLIANLESSSTDSQLEAARELRLLAKHSAENRMRIAEAGAVRPLVSLISSDDLQLQEQGVTAILNLSLCDENQDLIVSAGAIKPLVKSLKSGTSTARENSACALLRLAQIEENRIVIGRSGAIPPLVNLLETGAFRGKKDAATALYALCSKEGENRNRAVQAGVIRPLLDLMSEPESGMVDKAAYVLQTVVGGVAEAKKAVVEEDGLAVLVEMLEVGTHRHKEIAVDLLLQICEENPIYRVMVGREGAVPPLVALSQSGSSKAKKKAEVLIGLLRQSRNGGEGMSDGSL